MSAGLEAIRERMAEYLKGQGVAAVPAWPGAARERQDGPVTAVSLRRCQTGPAGFQDYLGERYNESTGLWEEWYGRQATLTFGLDLYAPAREDGEALQAAFDALAAALLAGGPPELRGKNQKEAVPARASSELRLPSLPGSEPIVPGRCSKTHPHTHFGQPLSTHPYPHR